LSERAGSETFWLLQKTAGGETFWLLQKTAGGEMFWLLLKTAGGEMFWLLLKKGDRKVRLFSYAQTVSRYHTREARLHRRACRSHGLSFSLNVHGLIHV
jgi:hypothetical protein